MAPADLSPQLGTSTFWIGVYGALQVVLWAKIMTIRAPQDPSTHDLRSLASSGDARNLCATRAHGNYIENAPMFGLLLVAIDASDTAPKPLVDLLGGWFAFGRIFHMTGLWSSGGSTVGRMVGAFCTLTSLAVGSALVLYSSFVNVGFSALKFKVLSIAGSVVAARLFAGRIVAEKKE